MAGLGSGVNYIPSSVGYASSVNTTTATLVGGASFTGTGEQSHLPYVTVDCTSDVQGTLYFEYSVNGSNWSTDPQSGFKLATGDRVVRSALKSSRYFRVRFVNGASAQSYFRLYTYYDTIAGSEVALNQPLQLDSNAVPTRPTVPQDEIIRGVRGGVSFVNQFGYRDTTLAASGEQTLWADNSNLVIMTAAATFTITYNAATDGSAGGAAGAKVLQVEYLDSSFVLQTAAHTLGNTGSDTTSFSGLGINKVTVSDAGTSNWNVNNITFSSGGNTQAFIPATDSVSQQLVYHCPIATTPIMKSFRVSTNKIIGFSPIVQFSIRSYNRASEVTTRLRRYILDTSTSTDIKEDGDIKLTATDVVYVTMDTDNNNTAAQGSFSINLYLV